MNDQPPLVEQEIRPGRWLYGVAGAFFVAGWVLFGVVIWRSLSSIREGLQRVVVPGKVELMLPKPGMYTIFHEYKSFIAGRTYATSRDVSGLECSLENKASGAPVKLSLPFAYSHYSMGGRSGVSYLDFHIDRPGIYVLSAKYAPGEERREVVLAVGQEFGVRMAVTVASTLSVLFACNGISVIIAVYTVVKRHRAGEALKRHASS